MITLDSKVDLHQLIGLLRTEERHLVELKEKLEVWKNSKVLGFLGLFSFGTNKEKERSILLIEGLIKSTKENVERYREMIENYMEVV